jgi:EAL domain-containing protein (putative c-di-GMP-specific phosphodiesterase class I)
VSINVSGRQLLDRAYAARTIAIIADSGIDPADITLELTETVFIDPRDEVDRALRSLRDAGVALALDDFGSGYSSLGHLRRYPIDGLKVDTTYTQALLHDPDTRIITEAMVTMANRLGLHLVAEGVETVEELEVVTSLGIDAAQGYLIARPQPVDVIIEQGLAHLGSALARARDHRNLSA